MTKNKYLKIVPFQIFTAKNGEESRGQFSIYVSQRAAKTSVKYDDQRAKHQHDAKHKQF